MHSKTLKRIPKRARILAAEALSSCINNCFASDSTIIRTQLLAFSYKFFRVPKKDANSPSLTSSVKQNINMHWNDFNWNLMSIQCQGKHTDSKTTIAKRAVTKLEDVNISGAVRILSSDKVFVSFDSVTLESLHAKHPPANSSVFSPPPPSYLDVYKASFSFPSGSAGGLDGLRPQYLKYMLCTQKGAAGAKLLKSVTESVNAMLSGTIPLECVLFCSELISPL